MNLVLDILIVLVVVVTVGIIGIWQHLSRGAWRNYPTGKALMSLLASHALIFGMFAVGVFIPGFPASPLPWIILCLILLAAKSYVGWVIWSINKEHRT